MKSKQFIQTDWLTLLLFTALVFLLRFPSFFEFGVGNGGDEGLYLLMARDWLEGKLPYTGIWDNKPVGIYIFYSLGLTLFSKAIVAIPILACVAVSISCLLLYKLGRLIGGSDSLLGLLAGILYAVFSVGTDELTANTEIFFIPFTLFSFYQLFQVKTSNSKWQNSVKLLLIGLAMGIALMIKQVVIFELIAIIILTVIILRFPGAKRSRYKLKDLLQAQVFLISGFITPSILVALYFLGNGHFSDYVYANFTANFLRVSGEELTIGSIGAGFLIQIKRNLFLLLGLFLTPFYMISASKNAGEKRKLIYLIIWTFAAFLGVSSPKSFYAHYFFQLLPPLSLLTAYLIRNTVLKAGVLDSKTKLIVLSMIFVSPMFNNLYPILNRGGKHLYFNYIKGVEDWGNTPGAIGKYLRQRVGDKDYIYVFNYYAVIYDLVPAKNPTKYAFPLFVTSDLSKIAGINPVIELDLIMAKKPLYIVKGAYAVDNVEVSDKMNNYLKKYYIFEKTFIDVERELTEAESQEIELYRRVH